ncbi:MAG: hypothetical protein HC944_02825 [Nanoarchaeota archaeon]|nr:hypothetical protein [Nanoarchaeota archaeon]
MTKEAGNSLSGTIKSIQRSLDEIERHYLGGRDRDEEDGGEIKSSYRRIE